MALLTVNALALRLMRENDEATDNTEVVSLYEEWIDDAIDEIASAHEWSVFKPIRTLSTVASTAIYDLDEDVTDIRAIRFVDTDEPIFYQDEMNLINVAANLENEGKPRNWFWVETLTGTNQEAKQIQLHPIPDAIYDLELSVRVHPTTTILGTSDAVPFRKEWILAIKHRVRAYALMNDKDYEGAKMYLDMFYDKLKAMIGNENSSPEANYLVMQPSDIPRGDSRHPILDPSHFSNRRS